MPPRGGWWSVVGGRWSGSPPPWWLVVGGRLHPPGVLEKQNEFVKNSQLTGAFDKYRVTDWSDYE
jgi:hypothetical protein